MFTTPGSYRCHPNRTIAQANQGFCPPKETPVRLRSESSVLQLTVVTRPFSRAGARRQTLVSLNLLGVGPEATGLQVHRSLPALLARTPGRPRGRRGPGPQQRRHACSSGCRPKSLRYLACSPVFELSPVRRLLAPHTHPDTWAR